MRPTRLPVLSSVAALALTLALAGCGGARSPYRAGGGGEAMAATSPGGAAISTGAGGVADDGEAIAQAGEPAERPGLGTRFGETTESRIQYAPFVRAAAGPFAEVAIHYNDASGIAAQAARLGLALVPTEARTASGGIDIGLVDDGGGLLPGFAASGRTFVVGQDGGRYRIVIQNHTGGRFEIVASVDGLDVVDGRPAGFDRRGYILAPYGNLVIDGFRTSSDTVAAFRFGAVADSYAARTGDDRNVGVVGVALFAENGSRWTQDWSDEELARRDSADPFPARYARPPN